MPESGAALPDEGRLQFHLERSTDSANGEIWADLLGAPGLRGNSFYYRPAEVSVGLEDGYPLDTKVTGKDFELIRLRPAWFMGTSVVFRVVLVSLAVLAMTSALLRDVGPEPVGERKGWFFTRRARKPYSLGRVQMAFWFVLVVGSFLFIWLVTGSSDTVTGSVLALIGIGAGAGLGSAVIDRGKDQTDDSDLKQMEAEEPVLKNEIQDLEQAIKNASPPDVPARVATRTEKQARLKRIADRIPALKESQKPQTSAGLFRDLLNDPVDGIGFHRFQMVVWTLVLGILFLRSVWERLAMPEFSATLLALLGISAGTFLGFKVPEGKSRS